MRVPSPALLILCACAPLALGGGALAHAIVTQSTPAPGSTVSGPDVALVLRFNSRIDHERSRMMLEGPDGKDRLVAVQTTGSPETLTGDASGLSPGGYRLRWQVLAVDGHITRGDIPFNVIAP